MGSSAKTGKKNFQGLSEHFLDKNAIWERTPPPPPTHQLQSTCVGRVQGSQIFKRNSIISIHSKVIFSDFVVPVVPMLSPLSPCHPHGPQKVSMWSPWLWSLWSPLLSLWSPPHVVPVVPIIPLSSPSSPHHPRIIPIIPTSFP